MPPKIRVDSATDIRALSAQLFRNTAYAAEAKKSLQGGQRSVH
jgi:hypothetical protein